MQEPEVQEMRWRQVPEVQEPEVQEPEVQESEVQESVEQESVEQKAVRGPVASSAPALASEVSILFSGDTQGVVFPQPGPFGSVGGLARRTSTVAHFRMEDPGVVLLDAGDAFTSGFERAEKINKVLVRVMNHLRYDAMGLGGLDLAMGEVPLRELAAMAKFPMVCSNLEFQQGVAPWIKPYVIFERNGRRIAVLSVLPAPSGAVITGARFVAPEKALGALLPKLRSTVDFVVLLTQLGSEEAAELLGEGSMVDVILGDRNAASMTSPAYVPAVPKGLGLGLLRLNVTAPNAPARVESMPVLLGADSDAQVVKILDELN
jgi:2',3'-cyclic-nucleotide 2'-phosphodiesterase (5'-nucleotidase family)